MCLQDIQLARSCSVRTWTLTSVLGSTVQVMPKNESRVGFYVTGPSGGTLQLYFGGPNNVNLVSSFTSTTLTNVRWFDIRTNGLAITDSIWIAGTVVNSINLYEYELPLDPENLQRLAAKGKW